jgi:hypothetical protein
MHIRSAVLAVILCGASFGCATPADEPEASAAESASAPQRQTGGYRTGSRLPTYEEKGGASSVGDVSRDDYTDEMRRGVSPTSGR